MFVPCGSITFPTHSAPLTTPIKGVFNFVQPKPHIHPHGETKSLTKLINIAFIQLTVTDASKAVLP